MITRFAPAPTGFLHLGHVVNAICVWGLARAMDGRVLLRIEDHDRQRSRPEYERALLDDLDWLGFAPDLYATSAFRAGRCESRQSDRLAVYESNARGLIARGLVYACGCSRREIAQLADPSTDGERPYPGTCRDRGLPLDGDVAWRARIDDGRESFDDLWCGPQTQEPAGQCGDVVIRDRHGQWTYQFVATVDDYLQGVDFVIRGRDLQGSTGRQIRLARLLGRERPARFAHHPLVMQSATQKLSKSDGATGIRDLRARGWTRDAVIAEAARRVGLIAPAAALSIDGVPALFRDQPPSTTFSNPTPVHR
jgi:glutamyl-tRNA synthetase/glutamyl-Q tRNA(Asp) synthetase